MINESLLEKFVRERNVKKGTIKGYISALKDYTDFQDMSIEELLEEARTDEENGVLLKNRKLKERLLKYRQHLIDEDMSPYTVKTYYSKVKTFYQHYEIELPSLPNLKLDKPYETNYLDLPTHEDIKKVLDMVPLDFKALILFMSSSGTARAETLSLTVQDFIEGSKDYYTSTNLQDILQELSKKDNVVPTLYLKRIKTNKYYYTFCSPEASKYIIKYLKSRENLEISDKLFLFSESLVITRFQRVNDFMKWGFRGKYRFFRSHALRKFHASNIGLHSEYIDALQGRSKNIIHETYIKTNPAELKKIYMGAMNNLRIYDTRDEYGARVEEKEIHEDFHITINVFLSDSSYTI